MSQKSSYDLIPTPASVVWREFRVQWVPFIFFLVALVVAIGIWRKMVLPAHFTGEVVRVDAVVTSPQAGTLMGLQVKQYQRVQSGDLIGHVMTTPLEVMASSLAVIRAQIELMRVNYGADADELRNHLDFERLRLDWMDQRSQLAAARVDLLYAEKAFMRVQSLVDQKIANKEEQDVAIRDRDRLRAEIQEREQLVGELGAQLEAMKASFAPESEDSTQNGRSLALEETRLRLMEAQLQTVPLTAPIAGQVSFVHHHSGENLMPGEAVVTLTSLEGNEILGYLPENLPFQPDVGTSVRVRAEGYGKMHWEGNGTIKQLSGVWMPATNSLSSLADAPVALGLPVVVELPAGVTLAPGRTVHLTLLP